MNSNQVKIHFLVDRNPQANCSIEVAADTFNFRFVDDKLLATYKGETVTFERPDAESDKAGQWIAQLPGVGTLTWSVCDDRLVEITVKVSDEFAAKLRS